MKKERLIIENRSSYSMAEVLDFVKYIVKQGRTSETSKGKQYCFVAVFNSPEIVICSDKNKRSDRLVITDDKHIR